MPTREKIAAQLEKFYGALSSANVEAWQATMTDDVIANVNGSTAVSGRRAGFDNLVEIISLVFARVHPEKAKIGLDWKIMCCDENRATVIFRGECETADGEAYNNRYVQILEFNDEALVCEFWEFFDTALANDVLFKDNPAQPEGTGTFEY